MNKVFCTIFTPTYNRAREIENLYNSLKSQESKNFEWLVVDDGSTDNTEEKIKKFINSKNDFPIRYIKQSNGGKHRAINKGLDYANGIVFFIVDSDDTIKQNAVAMLEYYVKSVSGSTEKFAGVAGLKADKFDNVIGERPQEEYIDCSNLERYEKNLLGDKAEAYFTEVLKRYKFPEFEGETFLTECVVWHKIAYDGYKIRWFNKVIYTCEYQEDGLTKNLKELNRKNNKGYLLNIKTDLMYRKLSIREKLAYIYSYYDVVKELKSKKQIAEDLNQNMINLHSAILGKKIKDLFKRVIL